MSNGSVYIENLSKSLNVTLNSFDTYDKDYLESPTDRISAVINLGIMIFGVLGNLICILVFSQKALLNRRFNWYFLALSFADLIFCFILLTNYSSYALFRSHRLSIGRIPLHLYDLSELTCVLYEYMLNTTDAFSVFLTLTLSIDRLYAITNPIKVRMFVTYRFPKHIIVIIYLALHLIKSPEIFLGGKKFKIEDEDLVPDQLNSSNIKTFACFPSDNIEYAKNSTALFIYVIYSNIFLPVILNILPGIAIVILNMTLWFFIRHYTNQISSKKLLNFGDQSVYLKSNTHRITKTQKSHYLTIIMIGVWLLLTAIPYYSLITYYMFIAVKNLGSSNYGNETFMKAQAISSVLYNLNHCINVVIYIFFHRDFRSSALNLFIKCFNINPVVKINLLVLRSEKAKKKARVKKDSNSSHSSITMGVTTNNNTNYAVSHVKVGSIVKQSFNETSIKNGVDSRNEFKKNSRLKTVSEFNRIANNVAKQKSAMNRLTVDNDRKDRDKSVSTQTINITGSRQSIVAQNNKDKIFIRNENFFLFRYFSKKNQRKIEMAERVGYSEKLLENNGDRFEFQKIKP